MEAANEAFSSIIPIKMLN